MSDEPLFQIIDDLVPPELFAEACKLSAAKGWSFGHGSNEGDSGRFWMMDLAGIGVFDAIWNHVRERCEQATGVSLRVQRQYANGHTYGLGGQPHVDDQRPGAFTLLYYPMSEWTTAWEGETVFYNDQGEVELCVTPRPNRAVLFDSRIPHAGRAPSRACPVLRVTVAFKLQVVDVASAAAAPPVLEEARHDGAEREYTVRIPAERVRRLVEEHLVKLGQSIRIPGFRPGQIPLTFLQQRYGDDARAHVLERLATEAGKDAPPGSLVVNINVSPTEDHVELRLLVVHLPALPEPPLDTLTLERLTAEDSALEAAGLTRDALAAHLKQQLLDFLDQSYSFRLPGALLERESAALWKEALAQGDATDSDRALVHQIAERRVRLGIVVTELARRHAITESPLEDALVAHLISKVRVHERPATSDDLRDLD